MPIRWEPHLAVGIEALDQQHQELFVRAGRLLAAVRAADRGEAERLLGLLGDYAAEHFAAEEEWMKSASFPDYAAHKAEHVRFMKEFLVLQDNLEAHGFIATVTVMIHGWLGAWLKAHIAGTDKKLAAHLLKYRQAPETAPLCENLDPGRALQLRRMP